MEWVGTVSHVPKRASSSYAIPVRSTGFNRRVSGSGGDEVHHHLGRRILSPVNRLHKLSGLRGKLTAFAHGMVRPSILDLTVENARR